MCGIVAIFNYRHQNSIDRNELLRIRDHMAVRGPDGTGVWYSRDQNVGLGHRRLSIIDPSPKGAQPMQSADGSIVVVLNGEIYNYQALKEDLQKKGRKFYSDSDTEVLLQLYLEEGENMFRDLRGMFAFAIWDQNKRAMLLARDPYGIKPLYYSDDGTCVRAASQVKALLAGGRISKEKSPEGTAGFFLLGSVPEPYTIFQSIRSIPAGASVWINERGASVPKRHFSVAQTLHNIASVAGPKKHASENAELIHRALIDSVKHHFVSDVEVGLFLSSGIDSGLLVALASEVGVKDLSTTTIAFEEFSQTRDDESPLAAQVAKKYGTRHKTRLVTKTEFRIELPKILDAMDQPTIDGINTYFASKAVSERGHKVALSGLGGDEFFGGYPSFWQVPLLAKCAPLFSWIPGSRRLNETGVSLARRFVPSVSNKFSAIAEFGGSYEGAYYLRRGLFLPSELGSVMDPEMAKDGLERLDILSHIKSTMDPDPQTPFGRIAALETSLYLRNQLLRDCDWAGMAQSVEIRTPYVDKQLFLRLAALLKGTSLSGARDSKKLLKNEAANILSEEVLKRAKTGFRTPFLEWAKDETDFSEYKGNCEVKRWAEFIFRHYVK